MPLELDVLLITTLDAMFQIVNHVTPMDNVKLVYQTLNLMPLD